jgi:hypothetical protein
MMVPDTSRDRHSIDFATLSELFGDTDPRIPALATGALDLQRLVFSEAVWRSINNNRTRVYDKLIEVYPEVAWREVKIAGDPIWQFVNRLNNSVHTNAKTRGGGKHKTQVIALQGGEFCLLCGSRDRPQVDHIVAVNLGGSKDDISNLQLLCERCNAAKSNIADYDIRIALRVLDKDDWVTAIGEGLKKMFRSIGTKGKSKKYNLEIVKKAKDGTSDQFRLVCLGR